MKVAPVSADLLVKLAIAGAVGLAIYYALKKAGDGLSAVSDSVGEVVDAVVTSVNPNSSENLVYKSTAAVGSMLVTDPNGPGKNADGSWSLGGWFYDITHPEAVQKIKALTADTYATPSPGHTAYWKS